MDGREVERCEGGKGKGFRRPKGHPVTLVGGSVGPLPSMFLSASLHQSPSRIVSPLPLPPSVRPSVHPGLISVGL